MREDLGDALTMLQYKLETECSRHHLEPIQSDKVKRAIFYARYEAVKDNSTTIELKHLIRGIAREMPQRSGSGKELHDERRAARITQAELAKLTGEQQSTISQFELGYVELPPERVARLFAAIPTPIYND